MPSASEDDPYNKSSSPDIILHLPGTKIEIVTYKVNLNLNIIHHNLIGVE